MKTYGESQGIPNHQKNLESENKISGFAFSYLYYTQYSEQFSTSIHRLTELSKKIGSLQVTLEICDL